MKAKIKIRLDYKSHEKKIYDTEKVENKDKGSKLLQRTKKRKQMID